MPLMRSPTGTLREISFSEYNYALQQGWVDEHPRFDPMVNLDYAIRQYRNSARRTIAIGTVIGAIKKTNDSQFEGWAKVLNLMRTFVKIKKQDAIAKSKRKWCPVEHDVEYLFRFLGLGYTSDPIPKPTLFNYSKINNLPQEEVMSLGNTNGKAILEFPDSKMRRIGEAILNIVENSKYKDLLEFRSGLISLAESMIAIGTHPDVRNSVKHDAVRRLGKYPHIYVFFKQ